MREISYAEAIMEAFREEMRRDDRVFHICGNLGPLAALAPESGCERRPSPRRHTSGRGSGRREAASGLLSVRA
jgi:hypothetical protein